MKVRIRLFLSVLILAIVIGFAHSAVAKVTRGTVMKWFDGIPEGVFIEGPVFDKDGNLWFVEIGSRWIARVTADKKYEKIVDLGHEWGPNGMKFDRKGNLIIAHRQRGILELNPKTLNIRSFRVLRGWTYILRLSSGER